MRHIHSKHQIQKRPILLITTFLLLITILISFLSQTTSTILEIETAESAILQGGDYWSQFIGVNSSYNQATASLLTSDGSLLVSGFARSFGAGGDDGWLVKLDQTGQILWQKTYGGSDEDDFNAPIETSDGNFIVIGKTSSFNANNNHDGWILKLNQNGTIIWQKTFGSPGRDAFSSIIEVNGSGYILSGSTDPDNDGNRNAWIVRLDAAGNLLWEKAFGSPNSDYSLGKIKSTSDGGFIIPGRFNGIGGDAWIIKLNSNGTIDWENKYSSFSALSNIHELSNGNFIAGGTITSDPRSYDLYMLKIDSNGQVIWQKSYGTDLFEVGASIQVINDNAYMVAGTNYNGDFWLLKLDGSGNIVWQKEYGDDDKFDVAGSLQRATNGDLYIVGYSNYSQLGKTFIVKVDSNGDDDNCNISSTSGTIVNLTAPATNANPANQTVNSTANPTTIGPQDSTAFASFICGGPPTSTLSGLVLDNTGLPLSGVTVAHLSGSTTTNASGNYTFNGLLPGTYTLLPSLAGYAFTNPSNHTVTVPPRPKQP